jgi:hypothetical protein
MYYIAGSFGNPEIVKIVSDQEVFDWPDLYSIQEEVDTADLMEFFTSYRSNTSVTVCAFAKHDVNCLQ